MRLNCPHCENRIELVHFEPKDPILCTACGSVFGSSENMTTATHGEPTRSTLGRFELIEVVGQGAFGTVYKARDPELDRLVAIKIPRSGVLIDRAERARFLREARNLARLRDPSIVPVYEVGQVGDLPYLVSEFISGLTLGEMLQVRTISPHEAATLVATVADALQHAHDQGIVHRDVKPSNIMIDDEGVTWLMDFGLAKREAGEVTMTIEGEILGTPAYMSPEQARGEASKVDARSDVYSLGVAFYQALTGVLPFRGTTRVLLHRVLHDDPKPPRSLNDRIPRDVEIVCLKAMAKEPGRRYQTAGEFAEDLRRYLAGEAVRARRVGHIERIGRRCRQQPALASLSAAVAFLTIGVLVGSAVAVSGLNARSQSEQAVREQLKRAENERHRAELVELAHNARLSGIDGWPSTGLRAISEAAAIRPGLDLRDDAVTCLVQPDLRRSGPDLEVFPPGREGFSSHSLTYDAERERFAIGEGRSGRVRICRVADGREIETLDGPGDPAWVLQFSPNGRYLAVKHHPSGKTRPVRYRVWDLTRRTIALEILPEASPWSLVFAPSGDRVAVCDLGGVIRLIDIASGRELRRLPPGGIAEAMSFRPDGHVLAVADAKDFQLRDFDDGRVLATLPHPAKVAESAWRGDGKYLATACDNHYIYVWDAESHNLLRLLYGHERGVTRVTFNRTGDLLASLAWDGTARLWDPLDPRPLATVPAIKLLGFSADDRRLGVAADNKTIEFRDVYRPSFLRTLYAPTGGSEGFWSADFSADGRLLVASGHAGLRLWDLDAGPLSEPAVIRDAYMGFFDHAGDLVTYGNGVLGLRSVQAGPKASAEAPQLGPSRTYPMPVRGTVNGDCFGMDRAGRSLVFIVPGTGEIFRFDTAHPGPPVSIGRQDRATFVSLSPDGRWAASSCWWTSTGPVTIWEATDRTTAPQRLPLPDASVMTAFSPDGRWLVTATTREYQFWRVGTWTRAHRVAREPLDTGPVLVAFSPDGAMAALMMGKLQLRLFETATGLPLATLVAPDGRYPVRLRFSPDGSRVAGACLDHIVHLWDLRLLRDRLGEVGSTWNDL